MTRIALVDDDRNILTSLSIMLENDGYEVDTYTDGEAALTAFGQSQPDAAILDVTMPRMDGLDLLQRLRQLSEIPVIMLTSRDSETDTTLGLRLGADDYVTKPFSHRVLLERLRACQRRAEHEAPRDTVEASTETLVRGPLTIDPSRHEAIWNGSGVHLTRIEFELLRFLAERPGYVRTRQQLLELVHGESYHAEDRIMDSHIQRLRRKMRAVEPDFDAIQTVHGLGYRYIELEEAAI
jgi:two-component system response regulator ChvI